VCVCVCVLLFVLLHAAMVAACLRGLTGHRFVCYCVQTHFCGCFFFNLRGLTGSDVSFHFCLLEKREGEDGDGCCAPNVQEFIYRENSVFTMGISRNLSFRDESRLSGRTKNVLVSAWSALLASDQIRSGRGCGSMSLSFLASIM